LSHGAVAFEYESGPPIEHGRLGIWLFVGSEAMFFAGLFSAWFVLRAGDPAWPTEPRVDLGIGIGASVLLALASLSAGAAVRSARRGAAPRVARWSGLAALAGALFLGVQAFEYRHLADAGIVPRTDVAAGMFFAITGAHGLHVLVGVVWQAVLAARAARGRVPQHRARHVEYGALYQHFVDVVWLGVLVALYVIG
jgi:heme/copper-type cytochrome/quinol oxidase subunit 3